MSLQCTNCKAEISQERFCVRKNDDPDRLFCSRRCVIEHLGPELSQAIVIKQWVPTEEEKQRMAE